MNWYLKKFASSITVSTDDYERSIREALMDLASWSMSRTDEQNPFTYEQAEEHAKELTEKTKINMSSLKQQIEATIKNIKDWNGSPIHIKARTYDRQNDFSPETDATIVVGTKTETTLEPDFTLFVDPQSGIYIDDVLDAGDPEFFQDENTQLDYFNLISKLRNPASNEKPQVLTLFTARPTKDREIYDNANSLPSNIFLTNRLDRVEGIAADFGGRDIYQVRVSDETLVKTLDDGFNRDYQTTRNTPIQSIRRLN